jgi:DNA topoisomerase II
LEKRPLQATTTTANITMEEKTELKHILRHPDTYVGSIEKHTEKLWVYENNEMVHRKISYVPGLYKIFDKILVDTADKKQRDPSMDWLKVIIDPKANMISVYHNGVPVEFPELIFSDDNVKKTTGGRNGYLLTNILSTEFVIEIADGRSLKKYKQVVIIPFLLEFFVF